MNDQNDQCKSAEDARAKLLSASQYMAQAEESNKKEIQRLRDMNSILTRENKRVRSQKSDLQERLIFCDRGTRSGQTPRWRRL